jgi:hypothetical protein
MFICTLAGKLNGASYGWGTTFTPIWLWLFFRNFISCYYGYNGLSVGGNIDFNAIYSGVNTVDQLARSEYCIRMECEFFNMFCCQVIPCFMFIGICCALAQIDPEPMTISLALFPFWFIFAVVSICCCCCIGACTFSPSPSPAVLIFVEMSFFLLSGCL